jgi:hypothetical protein
MGRGQEESSRTKKGETMKQSISRIVIVGTVLVILLLLNLVLLTGCRFLRDIPDIIPDPPVVITTTETTTTTTQPADPLPADFVPGYPETDKGGEIASTQFGMQVRYSANDSEKYRCAGKWYPIKASLVNDHATMTMQPDGTVRVWQEDFTTSSGHRYKAMGIVWPYSKEPLRQGPMYLRKDERHDAIRFHWATVK